MTITGNFIGGKTVTSSSNETMPVYDPATGKVVRSQAVLLDVTDFVGHHPGQFGLALGGEDQPGVHSDVAARHREGVEGTVVDREERKGQPRPVAHRHQAAPQMVEIILHLQVAQVGRIAPADLAHDLRPEALLGER